MNSDPAGEKEIRADPRHSGQWAAFDRPLVEVTEVSEDSKVK